MIRSFLGFGFYCVRMQVLQQKGLLKLLKNHKKSTILLLKQQIEILQYNDFI